MSDIEKVINIVGCIFLISVIGLIAITITFIR